MAGPGGAFASAVTSTCIRAVLLLTAASLTLRAQVLTTAVEPSSPVVVPRWQWDHCLAGITYGGPQKLAVSWGGGLVREGVGANSGSDYCAFGAAKVGLGGVRGAIGIGQSRGPLGSGAALSAEVLRTFAAPLGASAKRTYVGVTAHLWPLLGFGGEIGYFVRLGDAVGTPRAQRHVVTWSTGFGF